MEELIRQILGNLAIELPDDSLPDPATVSYYAMEKERKVYLDFEVSPAVIELQKLILRWNKEDAGKPANERQPIRLYIMSYGGDLDYMWTLVDAMMLSVTPIYTINMGVAASAAALIFLAGSKRFMTPNAKVLIHEGSAQVAGDANKVMDATKAYKAELDRMKEFILLRTEIPKKLLDKRRTDDWTIPAQECLDMKVCNRIIESIDEVL